jgi:hypothetical protein
MTAGGVTACAADCGTAMAPAGGGGMVAMVIMQPVQQQSAQIVPLPSSRDGNCCPASAEWQIMPPGTAAVSAAARATPKLAIKLERAIA